jgi:hypothetical protein
MAETELTIQKIGVASNGLTPNYGAANVDGHFWRQSGKGDVFLHLKNTNGATRTATVAPAAGKTPVNVPGAGVVAVPNLVCTVPATTGDKMFGPFPDAYVDANGFVHATFDAVTNLTVAAVQLERPAG